MARFSPTCFVAPVLLFCGMFFISGCGLWQDAPEEKGMKVTAAVRGVHYCSRLSPELSIANPPKGTDRYEVKLERLDDGQFYGGGTWAFDGLDGDGLDSIPEGALTSHYRGPCPGVGKSERFRFTVSAMGRDSKVPLEVRTYDFTAEK